MRRSTLVILALSCAPALLLGQNPPDTGVLMATVRSEAGAPLADAQVGAEGDQATTDAQGLARLILAAGRHRISVTRIGFQPATIQVQVPPAREIRVTVTLEPVAV